MSGDAVDTGIRDTPATGAAQPRRERGTQDRAPGTSDGTRSPGGGRVTRRARAVGVQAWRSDREGASPLALLSTYRPIETAAILEVFVGTTGTAEV